MTLDQAILEILTLQINASQKRAQNPEFTQKCEKKT